jgi:hypothetical protein
MTCDICRTEAIAFVHPHGALCDVCKRAIESGRYPRVPALPPNLEPATSGRYALVGFPDGAGSRLIWTR